MNMSDELWGNPIRSWLISVLVAFVVFALLLVARRSINRWLLARASEHDDETRLGANYIAASLVRTTSVVLLLAVSAWIGDQFLTLHSAVSNGLNVFLRLSLFFQIGLSGQSVITVLVTYTRGRSADRLSDSAMIGFSLLGKVTLWIVLIMVSLENLGVNMTTLIASLGVGGIAVGLAMQRVVGDLIASLAIVLDRPFTHGDFIAIDTVTGTVEKIGLKTTRIRATSGEELVVPNTDLIQGRIHNYRSLKERRIVLSFGVTFETPVDKLEIIPAIVRNVIEKQSSTRFDRAHFKIINSFSLDFEAVYFVTSGDYTLYMDIQQAINLDLIRQFADQHIDFSFPTQSVHLVPAAHH